MPLLTRLRGNNSDQSNGASNGSRPITISAAANPLKRRRRGRLLVLSAVLVVIGALVAVWLVSAASSRDAVLAVARPVGYGQQLASADLTTARIGTDPAVASVPAGRLTGVVGQYAAVDLPVGTLLTAEQLTTKPAAISTEQVVGVAVNRSQLPEQTIRARDRVLIAAAPGADAEPPIEDPQVIQATVLEVGRPDDSGLRVVEVSVPPTDGPRLAAWSATGRVAIVIEPRR
jgi:hypothetical protein